MHKGGISNRLYGCILSRESSQPLQPSIANPDLSRDGRSSSSDSTSSIPDDTPSSSDDLESEQVLVRVFGNGTEHFIDRDSEFKAMQLLHSFGLGAGVCFYSYSYSFILFFFV